MTFRPEDYRIVVNDDGEEIAVPVEFDYHRWREAMDADEKPTLDRTGESDG